jgi:5-deoxy-glucuronate isomerase
LRGSGNASRQIHTLIGPAFPADRLHVVEVWTPGGNWSSYPPHKHDEEGAGETVLDETYYFRTRDPQGFALQRLYSEPHGLDLTMVVRDGDLLTIPFGFHTTCAGHGFDLYYLNVLAGPQSERSLAAREDPDFTGIRAAWADSAMDPRLPLVS